jgi:hypothetical protein
MRLKYVLIVQGLILVHENRKFDKLYGFGFLVIKWAKIGSGVFLALDRGYSSNSIKLESTESIVFLSRVNIFVTFLDSKSIDLT